METAAEPEFDELVRLASSITGAPSAAISLVDETRQWFKARKGIPFAETPRDVALCSQVVETGGVVVIPDAKKVEGLKRNPLVHADDGISFYVGVPIRTRGGHCIGSFCVFDSAPRSSADEAHLRALQDLANLASSLIENRRTRRIGEIAGKVVAATSDAVLAADCRGLIVYWNAAAEAMFGFTEDAAIGQPVEILIPEHLANGHSEIFAAAAAGGPTTIVGRFVELEGRRSDGSEFPIELSLARWSDGSSHQGFAAIIRDISGRRSLERERQQANALLHSVVANMPSMLSVKDSESLRYLLVNRAGEDVLGHPSADIVGRTDGELRPEVGARFEHRDIAARDAAGPQVHETVLERPDGRLLHLRTTRVAIDGPERPAQFILGVSEDVTQMRQAEADVLRLAQYDALTGLLNRQSHLDRLDRLVAHQVPFAMLCIDLDRFKAVNDQFGHIAGDGVLVEVAERLRSIAGASDWTARIGGDEFVMILLGGDLDYRARKISKAIVDRLGHVFEAERTVAFVGASVGGAMFPRDGVSIAQLRERADFALYRAKHAGRGTACFFDADMDAAARDRRALEIDLRAAIASDAIALVYQPVVSILTGRVTSLEALARWTAEDHGAIPPSVFIPLAEECGLIDLLGENILRKACSEAASWPSDVRIAVNLSPLQFLSGKLLETVGRVLSETGFPARRLQLEVTEGLVIRDVERTFGQLQELRDIGVQILMDDFGTGYSSLSYFQRFPFDKVKVDRSFVAEVTTSRAACAIITAIIGLGGELGMAVVAEGVETTEQMQTLISMGCTHLQGYLFGRPLPASLIPDCIDTSDFGLARGGAANSEP